MRGLWEDVSDDVGEKGGRRRSVPRLWQEPCLETVEVCARIVLNAETA